LAQTPLPQREAKKQMILHEEKRRILNEYSHHAAVNYIAQVPKVYGLFELDSGLGILMEKVSGPELSRLQPFAQTAVAHRAITPEQYLQISLRSIADTLIALGEMHKRNLTHSDVKRENVMWDDTNLIFKLMDYGGARQLDEKANTFSPGYIQLSGSGGRNVSLAHPRNDIYQTGQTLHYLLTGETAGTAPREFKDGASIKFITALRGLNDTQKNQLAELLNGMVAPEMEDQDQDLRKSAKELLESPLFENLASRKEVGETIRMVNKWAEGS
jgi:serine/threonine protein kinase